MNCSLKTENIWLVDLSVFATNMNALKDWRTKGIASVPFEKFACTTKPGQLASVPNFS
jgi:hypothetical protein